jgi:predicted DNA-binding protein
MMPHMKGKRAITNVYLDPDALQALKALSASTGVSMAEYIREGVAVVLKKYARELRRAKR